MPPGGAQARAEQLATISRLAHEMFTSPATEALLAAAEATQDGLDAASDEAALLRVTRRDLNRARKLPPEFVAERARAASQSVEIWRRARPANDLRAFLPSLERMIELARRTADYLGYKEHPYDALLDLYEPETTAREVARSSIACARAPFRSFAPSLSGGGRWTRHSSVENTTKSNSGPSA